MSAPTISSPAASDVLADRATLRLCTACLLYTSDAADE